jgi:hypothetical protein
MNNYNQQANNWTNFANQAFAIGAQGLNTIGSAIDAKYTPATAETTTGATTGGYSPFNSNHNDLNPQTMA